MAEQNTGEKRIEKIMERGILGFFLNSKAVWQLLLKWLILLAIPYANLMLCGLVFDRWLKWYSGSVYIFVWFCLVAAAALTLGVIGTVRYITKVGRR